MLIRVAGDNLIQWNLQIKETLGPATIERLSSSHTVEPPIKDTPNKGHNINNLQTKDKLKGDFPIVLYTLNLR